ncbi:MAG: glutamate dehydrogenase [Flavobacterium sp.]
MLKNNWLTLWTLLILLGFSSKTNAQFGLAQEIGIIAGPVAFQSDYGLRNNISTNIGNSGLGIGIVHYLNFSYKAECNCYTPETYFNDHFKLRTELSYNKSKFKHFGEWVSPEKTSLGADQLRGMRGSSSLTNLGMQLEYFPLSVRDFSATIGSFAPYISLGGQISYYKTEAHSTLGTLGNPLVTFPKYLTPTDDRQYGFSTESGTVLSVVTSVGTRYKLAPLSDLMVDFRLQYYFSDWVDGLKPNPDVYKENKANDWLVWFNVGYIYYLQ